MSAREPHRLLRFRAVMFAMVLSPVPAAQSVGESRAGLANPASPMLEARLRLDVYTVPYAVKLAAEHLRLVATQDGRFSAFLVSEAGQGGTDLNGDGDALDYVVHVLETESAIVHNTGLAASSSASPGFEFVDVGADFFWWISSEAANAASLNGDADPLDDVLTVYHPETESLYMGWDVLGGARRNGRDDRGVLYTTEEAENSVDLNGDGDMTDVLAVTWSSTAGGEAIHDESSGVAIVDGDWAVYQHTSGGQPTNEWHWVHHPAGGGVLQLGDDLSFSTGTTSLSDSHWLVLREENGSADWNGDGDMADFVYWRYALDGSSAPLCTGLASGDDTVGRGETVDTDFGLAFMVSEQAQGQDLTSDGDLTDWVVGMLPNSAGVATVHPFASSGGPRADNMIPGDHFRVSAGSRVVRIPAVNGGLHLWDSQANAVFVEQGLVVLPMAGSVCGDGGAVAAYDILGQRIGYSAVASTPLNYTEDFPINLSILADVMVASDRHVLVGLKEADYGSDVNGDADLEDRFPLVIRIRDGEHAVAPIDGIDWDSPASRARFYMEQGTGSGVSILIRDEALLGDDLNGDGDVADQVPTVVRVR